VWLHDEQLPAVHRRMLDGRGCGADHEAELHDDLTTRCLTRSQRRRRVAEASSPMAPG
jgi:hypothetical protein